MRTSFHHQSEAQSPNGPLTAATSPDTPSPGRPALTPSSPSPRNTLDFPRFGAGVIARSRSLRETKTVRKRIGVLRLWRPKSVSRCAVKAPARDSVRCDRDRFACKRFEDPRLYRRIQIEGSSYRLRQHTDLMPEHVRSKALINAPFPAQPPRRRGRPPKHGATDHPAGCKSKSSALRCGIAGSPRYVLGHAPRLS